MAILCTLIDVTLLWRVGCVGVWACGCVGVRVPGWFQTGLLWL
jgi:hypothetical protein